MSDKDKLIEYLEGHLGKDDTGKLLSKLKDMHTRGSSPAELQEEIYKTLKEQGVEEDMVGIEASPGPPPPQIVVNI